MPKIRPPFEHLLRESRAGSVFVRGDPRDIFSLAALTSEGTEMFRAVFT